ncbi:hypothetical protein PCE1_004178 [Barthelona sp. PCE]
MSDFSKLDGLLADVQRIAKELRVDPPSVEPPAIPMMNNSKPISENAQGLNPAMMAAMEQDAKRRLEDRLIRERAAEPFKEAGNNLFRKGKHREAIEQYTEAITRLKDFWDARNNRAYCFILLNEHNDAMDDLNVIIDVTDGLIAPRLNLDRIKFRARDRRSICNIALGDFALAAEDISWIIENSKYYSKNRRRISCCKQLIEFMRDNEIENDVKERVQGVYIPHIFSKVLPSSITQNIDIYSSFLSFEFAPVLFHFTAFFRQLMGADDAQLSRTQAVMMVHRNLPVSDAFKGERDFNALSAVGEFGSLDDPGSILEKLLINRFENSVVFFALIVTLLKKMKGPYSVSSEAWAPVYDSFNTVSQLEQVHRKLAIAILFKVVSNSQIPVPQLKSFSTALSQCIFNDEEMLNHSLLGLITILHPYDCITHTTLQRLHDFVLDVYVSKSTTIEKNRFFITNSCMCIKVAMSTLFTWGEKKLLFPVLVRLIIKHQNTVANSIAQAIAAMISCEDDKQILRDCNGFEAFMRCVGAGK